MLGRVRGGAKQRKGERGQRRPVAAREPGQGIEESVRTAAAAAAAARAREGDAGLYTCTQSAYVKIRQHMSAYVSISQLLLPPPRWRQLRGDAGLYTCILTVSPNCLLVPDN